MPLKKSNANESKSRIPSQRPWKFQRTSTLTEATLSLNKSKTNHLLNKSHFTISPTAIQAPFEGHFSPLNLGKTSEATTERRDVQQNRKFPTKRVFQTDCVRGLIQILKEDFQNDQQEDRRVVQNSGDGLHFLENIPHAVEHVPNVNIRPPEWRADMLDGILVLASKKMLPAATAFNGRYRVDYDDGDAEDSCIDEIKVQVNAFFFFFLFSLNYQSLKYHRVN